MAHKRKAPIMPFLEMQQKKTEHYKRKDQMLQKLKEERTKENAMNEQIRALELNMLSCQNCLKQMNKHPDVTIYANQQSGYMLAFKGQEAFDAVRNDEQSYLKALETAKTQMKFCVETQQRIENMMKSAPTFAERMQHYNQTGNWKW